MGWIQVPSFGTFELKPVRLFSDITRRDTATDEMALIMPQLPPAVTKAKADSCPPGVESIIDFSDSTQRGMRPFYEALLRRNEMQRPVRIAYFGDSFIEGDILTADLRALLQGEYGGAGAGFSDMAPPFAGFRISLPLHASGWDVRNVLQKDSCERHRLGPTQRYAIPTDSAYTEARGCRHYAHLDTFHRATIYLSSPRPLQIRIRRNRNASETLVSQGTGQLETLVCQGAMGRKATHLPPATVLPWKTIKVSVLTIFPCVAREVPRWQLCRNNNGKLLQKPAPTTSSSCISD